MIAFFSQIERKFFKSRKCPLCASVYQTHPYRTQINVSGDTLKWISLFWIFLEGKKDTEKTE